jgi:hypothetical protein
MIHQFLSYLLQCLGDPKSILGPYTTTLNIYKLDNSDIQNPQSNKVSVYFPSGLVSGSNVTYNESTKFKFISYAHGMFGGGTVDIPAYNDLLHAMASFGYIIGATHQCTVGCFDDCNSLRGDPPCFGNYYKKQLAIFDWAKECTNGNKECSESFKQVNWDQGVGIAGHSMGGQATLFSSSESNASSYNIRAAVLHHAFSHNFPIPTVPFIDFTGELDNTAPPDSMGLPIYEAADYNNVDRVYVDKTYATHHEPDITCMDRNGIQLLAQFSAAWLKIYLDETPQSYGLDFYDMIYGTNIGSLCAGGDGIMAACVTDKRT